MWLVATILDSADWMSHLIEGHTLVFLKLSLLDILVGCTSLCVKTRILTQYSVTEVLPQYFVFLSISQVSRICIYFQKNIRQMCPYICHKLAIRHRASYMHLASFFAQFPCSNLTGWTAYKLLLLIARLSPWRYLH